MNRHFSLFLIAVFTITQSVFGQKNYLRYYDLINQAEEQFVINNNNVECYKLYDKAFAEFERPFAKDIFIASQIAYYNGDTLRFFDLIEKGFNSGITLNCLHQTHLFDALFTNKSMVSRVNAIYEKRNIARVDNNAKDSTYMRFYQEQILKRVKGGELIFC